MNLKRTMCALLAATMLVPTAVMAETAASAAEVDCAESAAQSSTESSGANSYGLADNIQDGVILHCFDWKYSDIQAELPNIAAAGFTSVQTSPAQPNGTGVWYWLYQPQGFYIGTNGLGTKAELQSLCTEAEKYGIKVIVDVVANHLAGDHSGIQDDLKGSQYWHTYGGVSDWNDRYQVIYGDIGMTDLATENSYVQNTVKNYILELKGVGVDGIRWDAAKHIGLPGEQGDFWPTVTDTGLWNYGEILDSPGGDGTSIMKNYTNYISVTDSVYAISVRDGSGDKDGGFRNGKITDSFGNWAAKGIAENKLVYWAESHDTWANASEWGYSWDLSQNTIDRTYAVVASRYGATALYFSRPFSNPSAKENTKIGEKGSTHYTEKEVAEINKFHNAMIGKKDYYTSSNGCAVVTRQGGGAVIVKGSGSGSVSVTNGGGYAKAGTYKDAISGNTFTVTSSTISGNIGDSGIAVIYDASDVPVSGGVSASVATGTSFTDSLSVTLTATDVTSATYKTSEGASGSFTSGQTITLGSSTAEGSSVTLTLTGTKADGSTATATYTYNKTAPKEYPTLDGAGFVYDNSTTNWGSVYAYVYSGDGSSATSNAAWPGVKMTDCGNGYWKYNLDSKFSSGTVRVIFSNNGSNQIPGSQEPGYQMNVTDKKLYENSTWQDLPETSNLKVSLSASASSVNVGDSVTLTATATGASGTVNYTFSDGSSTIQASSTKNTATWTPSAEGTYTITVTAKDSKTSKTATTTVKAVKNSTDPLVSVDKASGTSFTSETMSLKLTLSNATSGTYSVDNGPTKSFTGSKTITIGEGKIGDSTVTVKTTAANANGTTKTYTYTYEKKYEVKTSSSSSSAATATESSGAALASQYKTNPNGVGKNKTITVDGDISDWSSDMLIAQGAANDDPRVYRPNSMYELPVDLYALYGAYDDNNLYLMWEMTNVQDVVAPNDNYPLSQGILWQTQEFPFFIAIDTGKSDTVGKNGQLQTGGTIWNSGMTITNRFNRLISINTKGGNGPFVYSGDSTGLNATEIYDATTSKIKMGYGKGILSSSVKGINGAYGESNNRVVGDVCSDSAAWVDFNTKGHSSSTMDFFYELSIPYSELGITKSDVQSNGVGVLLVGTMGKSGLDCLPYDFAMNDNADLDDAAGSQENNSFEKSDEDNITTSFARIGAQGSDNPTPNPTTPLQVNFGTDRSAPQLATTALKLKGIGYGGTAPYKYQFSVDGTVVKASNTTDTYSWTPGSAGSHTIQCVITDSTGATATVKKTFTAETSGTTTLTNNSKISATSVEAGTTVTLTGAASNGTSPYKYAYYYKRTTQTNWTVMGTEFGTATSASVKPSSKGDFELKVIVKDNTGATATKTFNLTVTDPSTTTLTNSSTISATSVPVGTSVTLKGVASGGTSPYKYAYYYKRDTATNWTVLGTEFGTATSASVKPSSAGTLNLKVVVKDSAGTTKTKTFTLTITDSLVNNSKISATSVPVGTSVTLTGAASGGKSSYKYAYYYKRDTATNWTVIGTEFGTATTASVKPSSTGTLNLKVVVKDSAGTTATKTFTLTITDALVNNSKISATSVPVGTTVTLTGAASGGKSSYKYAYYYKRDTATNWTVIGTEFGTATTASVKPSSEGTLNLKVVVKDSNGATATKTFTLTITNSLTNNSKVSTTNLALGNTLTITGAASGGKSSYKYAYYYKRTTQTNWTTIGTEFGTATSATLKPSSEGTFSIKVVVKDSSGATATKTFTVVCKQEDLANTSKVSTTSLALGSTLTITGAATGGSGKYSYAYYYKRSTATNWTTLGTEFGTATTATVKPSSAGTLNIKVIVKDNNTAETVTKTFTVTIK